MRFAYHRVCDRIMESIIFFSISIEQGLSKPCSSNSNSIFGKFMLLFTITKAGASQKEPPEKMKKGGFYDRKVVAVASGIFCRYSD